MKPVVTAILCVIAFFVIRALFTSWFQDQLVSNAGSTSASCLAMLGSTTSEENGHTYIIGNIRNNCSRTVGSVTVFFKLDRRGVKETVQGATVAAYTRDLKVGETRRFKSTMAIGEDSTFRFDTIVAY